MPSGKKYEIPKGCPSDLRALIEKLGTKVATFKALGVSKETFTRVVNGGEKMPSGWAEKIESVMKGEALPSSGSHHGGPEFRPWDGTKANWTMPARGNSKARVFKNVPTPVIEVLEKHDNIVSAAARAMGTTGNTLTAMIENKTEFNDKRQRMIFEGLHGVPASRMDDVDGPDQFKRGLVVVVVASKNYDRVKDLVDLLEGEFLFRVQTPAGWVVMYGMSANDARKFKRIAQRDCVKVVCP